MDKQVVVQHVPYLGRLPMNRQEILQIAGDIPEVREQVEALTDAELYQLQFLDSSERGRAKNGIVTASLIAELKRKCQMARED